MGFPSLPRVSCPSRDDRFAKGDCGIAGVFGEFRTVRGGTERGTTDHAEYTEKQKEGRIDGEIFLVVKIVNTATCDRKSNPAGAGPWENNVRRRNEQVNVFFCRLMCFCGEGMGHAE